VLFSLQIWNTFILKITELDMIKIYIGLHVNLPLFFSDFNNMKILDRFLEYE
jgi:hypothetical protein